MLFLLLVICCASKVSTTDGCKKNVYEVCPNTEVASKSPVTKEELRSFCDSLIEELECIINYEEKCNTNPEYLEISQEMLAFVLDNCNEEDGIRLYRAFSVTDECEKSVQEVCQKTMKPRKFQVTKAELRSLCNTFTECIVKYEEKCNTDQEYMESSQRMLAVLSDVCNEDTLLHKAIVENLKCFSKYLWMNQTNKCYYKGKFLSEEKMTYYFEALVDEGLLDNETSTFNKRHCIQILETSACNIVDLEKKCGTAAMNASMELMWKYISIQPIRNCGENFHDLLPTFIRIYKQGNQPRILWQIGKRRHRRPKTKYN